MYMFICMSPFKKSVWRAILQIEIVTLTFDLVIPKINRDHILIMKKRPMKFEDNGFKRYLVIGWKSFLQSRSVTLT